MASHTHMIPVSARAFRVNLLLWEQVKLRATQEDTTASGAIAAIVSGYVDGVYTLPASMPETGGGVVVRSVNLDDVTYARLRKKVLEDGLSASGSLQWFIAGYAQGFYNLPRQVTIQPDTPNNPPK